MSNMADFQSDRRLGGGAARGGGAERGGGAARGGGSRVRAAPQLTAQEIPQWRNNPPPGLRQYLERQRQGIPGVYESAQRAQEAERGDAPAVPVVNAMEEALGDMERVLADETSWKSDILPRGHIIEGGFQTRHAAIASLKMLCHEHGFRVGCYVGGHETSFGSKTLRLQCTCGRPRKQSDQRQRHFNSRHSCLGCKWFRNIIPFERGNDTPVVIDEASGESKPVYPQCKWMISNHASSLHCDDHTGHCQVPPNHLPGITTSSVQSIIAEHGMLDSSPASGLDEEDFQLLDRWLTNAGRDDMEEQYELASILGRLLHFFLKVMFK